MVLKIYETANVYFAFFCFIKCLVLKILKRKLKLFGWGTCQIQRKKCEEYDLGWEQKPIKILGVTLSVDVCNIGEHNADDIIYKINRMVKAWSKTKLTLPGKSLNVGEIYTSVSCTSKSARRTIKILDRTFYKFLWNNGPDRISRENI